MRNLYRPLLLCTLVVAILAGCAKSLPKQPTGYVDAVELKLKCRELADQMLATVPNGALQGFVAMPTSFVNENNTSQSSPLGRVMAESMYYEFNQRGFPTREYRLTGKIDVVGGKDDLALVANQIIPTAGQKWAALLVGTYYVDRDATFINARLVRASDGLVLRTGQLVLENTPVIMRMAGQTIAPARTAGAGSGASGATSASALYGIPIVQGR